MSSADGSWHYSISAAVLAGFIGFAGSAPAQPSDSGEAAGLNEQLQTQQSKQRPRSTVDRSQLRLNLLITLVENELQEATLLKARLTEEAAKLDQERRSLPAQPSRGTAAEKKRIEVIDKQLQRIDNEMADVDARLLEINAELEELQDRHDGADGVVQPTATELVVETDDNGEDDEPVDGSSHWLDSKRQIQEALVYLGGYNALIDGDFGPRTRQAVRVYQGRQGAELTGTLDDAQEKALLDQADVLRRRYGMTFVEDADAGYRLSYPSGLLSEESAVEPNGRRYVTEDGRGELLITVSDDWNSGAAGLSAIYNELLGLYEVQYRRKRNDWFVVAGLQDQERIVYDTVRLNGDSAIRARLSYPAEWRTLWSPFAVIMFNSFTTFPSGSS